MMSVMRTIELTGDDIEQLSQLEIGKEYLITIKRTDPLIPTLVSIHKTKAAVVDWFNNGLYFWFDDAYGQECFSPIEGVIAVEDL